MDVQFVVCTVEVRTGSGSLTIPVPALVLILHAFSCLCKLMEMRPRMHVPDPCWIVVHACLLFR
jgi:hypothetical protein